jgi:hypothetical protein
VRGVGSSRQSAATDVVQLIYFFPIRSGRTRPAACRSAESREWMRDCGDAITLWRFAWPKARESLSLSEPNADFVHSLNHLQLRERANASSSDFLTTSAFLHF